MTHIHGYISCRDSVTAGFISNQRGYVLIVGMLALCLLSLMGIWALNTSDFEFKIASNLQTRESNLNIAEGAAKQEGAAVGFVRAGFHEWYQISSPETFNQFLYPSTSSEYDPGSDIATGTFPADFKSTDYGKWPRQNLLQDPTDDQYDYAYLVTYLHPDNPPKGYDASMFSGYKFRITSKQKRVVEIGGIKVGVKAGS